MSPWRTTCVRICSSAALVMGVGLVGCDQPDVPPVPPGAAPPPCEPAVSMYLLTEVTVWPSAAAAAAPRIDLDMDGRFTDNDLGEAVAWLVQRGARIQRAVDYVLTESDHAFMLRVEECGDSYVRMTQLVVADDDGDPDNDLDAGGRFRIVTEPEYGAVGTHDTGAIRAFHGRGYLPFRVLFDVDDQQPLDWIAAAGVQFDVIRTDRTLAGLVAGGYVTDDLRADLSEQVARSLNDIVTQDPGCPQMCESEQVRLMLDLYDVNQNGTISVEEAATFFTFLDESLDLFSAFEGETTYWPNSNGVRDSRGLMVQFVAARTEALVQ